MIETGKVRDNSSKVIVEDSFRRSRMILGFPDGSVVKESAYSAGDVGSIPGSGRSPGGGNGNSLQCSCLGNPMDTRGWRATVHGVAKNRTQLSN